MLLVWIIKTKKPRPEPFTAPQELPALTDTRTICEEFDRKIAETAAQLKKIEQEVEAKQGAYELLQQEQEKLVRLRGLA